jgi:hypothetical protein
MIFPHHFYAQTKILLIKINSNKQQHSLMMKGQAAVKAVEPILSSNY